MTMLRAMDLVESVPWADHDDLVLPWLRRVVNESLPGLMVTDHGGQSHAVGYTELMWLLLPGYLHGQPLLATACSEAVTEQINGPLSKLRIADLVPKVTGETAWVPAAATPVEIVEVMTRHHSDLVATFDRDGVAGVVTSHRLLRHVMDDVKPVVAVTD